MHDDGFRAMLANAAAIARRRAPQVSTIEGYYAVMAGLSNGLYDKHLSYKPALSIARPGWVGVIIALRGGHWVVADEDPWPGRAPLKGAVLVSCDGRSADDIARERLGGFRAEWSIPAQRGLAAPWLLIDEHNPFLKPLQACTFASKDGPRDIALDWQPVSRDLIISRMNRAAGIGAAGYGVRRAGAGWWVSINELTDKAPAVIASARAVQAQLRAAPFIVFDVRGNGGGSSDIGDQLARIIYGANVIPPDSDCLESWRVSPENQALLDTYLAKLGDRLSPQARASITSEADAMRRASAAGQAFSRPLRQCRGAMPVIHARPRVYLLTDRVCFSSCLLVTRTFRALGAVQIGEATNANTYYQENRRVTLPSGLGNIGVQASVDLSLTAHVGPFLPEIPYPGDLTDTAAVQAWVLANAAKWATRPPRDPPSAD